MKDAAPHFASALFALMALSTGAAAQDLQPPPPPMPPPIPSSLIDASLPQRDPARRTYIAPDYPMAASCAGIGGTSVLLIDLDERGKPTHVRVERSSRNASLDAAAERAARSWRFDPAIVNGDPAPSIVRAPVMFDPPTEVFDYCLLPARLLRAEVGAYDPDDRKLRSATHFSRNEAVLAEISVDVKDATVGKAIWYRLEEAGQRVIDEKTLDLDTPGVHSQTSGRTWDPGDYRLDVFVNDTVKASLTFRVDE